MLIKNNGLIGKIKARFNYFLNEKKALELSMLGYLLIALGVLVIGLVSYFIVTGKMTGAVNFVKNLFRFGI